MSLGAVRRRSGGESNGSLFNKVKPAILGASPSSFSRVFITNALCTLVLECDVAPHPPPPVEAWWGGLLRTPPNLLGPLLKHQSHLLRRRCDARGFGHCQIEIIAERKVALTFERIGRAIPQIADANFCFAHGQGLAIATWRNCLRPLYPPNEKPCADRDEN